MMGVRVWLAGKKTYILGALVLVAFLALVATGRLTPTTALAVIAFAAGSFPMTLSAKLQRHQDQEIAILRSVALGGAAIAAHNLPAAEADAVVAIQTGIALGQEVRAESQTSNVVTISQPEVKS